MDRERQRSTDLRVSPTHGNKVNPISKFKVTAENSEDSYVCR